MNVRCFEDRCPVIAAGVYVDGSAVVIGDVHLGQDASVWPMAVVRGDIHSIRIGARTNIQDGSVLHVTHDSRYNPGGHPLVLGDEVTVGHHVVLHGCTVGNRCLIGMGSLIMDGAVLHSQVMLGAGSLVTPGKELEGGHLWLGRPAKRIRLLEPEELDYLEYAAARYVRLKRRYAG